MYFIYNWEIYTSTQRYDVCAFGEKLWRWQANGQKERRKKRKRDAREGETIAGETGKSTACRRGWNRGGRGRTRKWTLNQPRGAVKSLALITEGSKENDGVPRYSIMFLRFARAEGETVYLCYWHFSFDRLYSRLVIPRAGIRHS